MYGIIWSKHECPQIYNWLCSGYNFESGGVNRLSDGKRELLNSEKSELGNSLPSGSQYCAYLKMDGTEVMWDSCSTTRQYLCEYKGKESCAK